MQMCNFKKDHFRNQKGVFPISVNTAEILDLHCNNFRSFSNRNRFPSGELTKLIFIFFFLGLFGTT